MRRRTTSCGVLPDLSIGSVPSMIAVKGTFSRKTAVASRRALPLTATTTSAPGRLVNGWTETSFGSPGATGALGAPRADALPPSTAAKIATHAADMRTLEPITITDKLLKKSVSRKGAKPQRKATQGFLCGFAPWRDHLILTQSRESSDCVRRS